MEIEKYCLLWIIPYHIYFWVICISTSAGLVIDCVEGHEWIAHFIMVGFLGAVFFMDLFFFAVKKKELFKKYEEEDEGEELDETEISQRKSDKRSFVFWWLFSEFCSILSLFDVYTDLCFIVISYKTPSSNLTLPALLCLIISSYLKVYAVYKSFTLIFKKVVSGEDLYNLFAYNELQGNAYLIRNEVTSVVRLRGKILAGISKFFLEDLVQVIIQLNFILAEHCHTGEAASGSTFLVVSISCSLAVSLLALLKGLIILICI